jgi:hypothetical protein
LRGGKHPLPCKPACLTGFVIFDHAVQ